MLNLDKFEVETDGKYGIPANKGTKKIPNVEYGFEAMLERLNPCSVLYYGKKHTESPLIVEMGTPFYNKFTKKERKKDGR